MAHRVRRLVATAAALGLSAAGPVLAATPAAAEPLNRCAPSENGDPVLDRLTMSPQVVDARAASRTVRITAEAHDTGGPGPRTGIRSIGLVLSNRRHVDLRWTGGHTWVGETTVPRWSRPGPIFVRTAFLSDRADYPDRTLADDDGLFDVVYQAGGAHPWSEVAGDRSVQALATYDSTRPRVTDLDLYPATVDTRRRAQLVYVTTRAFDGVSGVHDARVDLTNDATGVTTTVHLRVLPGRHGLLRGRFTLARHLGDQVLTPRLTVRDNAGRRTTLGARDLRAAGLPAALRVHSGPPPPSGRAVVRSSTVTPTTVDVHDGDRSVTYRVRATNRLGTVRAVSLWFPFSAGIRSISTPRLVSGDRHDGVWSSVVVVDGCRTLGGRLRPLVTAYDTAREDEQDGAPLEVLAPDNTNPTYEGFERAGDTVVLRFDEDVNGISTRSVDLTRAGSGASPVSGRWACADLGGSPTACLTGAVRTASFTPDTPLPAGEEYALEVNPEGNLDVTDLAGNPAVRRSH